MPGQSLTNEEIRESTSAWWLLLLLGLISIAAGVLVPGQPATYDLADGPKALAELESRATVGKLALLP